MNLKQMGMTCRIRNDAHVRHVLSMLLHAWTAYYCSYILYNMLEECPGSFILYYSLPWGTFVRQQWINAKLTRNSHSGVILK